MMSDDIMVINNQMGKYPLTLSAKTLQRIKVASKKYFPKSTPIQWISTACNQHCKREGAE